MSRKATYLEMQKKVSTLSEEIAREETKEYKAASIEVDQALKAHDAAIREGLSRAIKDEAYEKYLEKRSALVEIAKKIGIYELQKELSSAKRLINQYETRIRLAEDNGNDVVSQPVPKTPSPIKKTGNVFPKRTKPEPNEGGARSKRHSRRNARKTRRRN